MDCAHTSAIAPAPQEWNMNARQNSFFKAVLRSCQWLSLAVQIQSTQHDKIQKSDIRKRARVVNLHVPFPGIFATVCAPSLKVLPLFNTH